MSQVLKQAKDNEDQYMLDVLGEGSMVKEENKRFGFPEACNCQNIRQRKGNSTVQNSK